MYLYLVFRTFKTFFSIYQKLKSEEVFYLIRVDHHKHIITHYISVNFGFNIK